jgi:hypothetical protein
MKFEEKNIHVFFVKIIKTGRRIYGKPIIFIYKLKSVLISSYYALIEALISQRDISKGMG